MAPQTAATGGDQPAFPTKQLTILAICRFAEPIAFNSILAYTYVMVQDLHDGSDKDASFYAGLLVSAYAVAESITAMGWGVLSDRYGRKPIVLFGLVGVAISSLIFGLAKNYWVALLARFVGGALNGNVAVMQTMVAEMVKVPEHEPKAYASQPFVWTLGGIIGSAMGGFLAQPAKFYPETFPEDGLFGRYPYLLPNLVAVVVIALAILQGIFFLEETNPPHLRNGAVKQSVDTSAVDDSNDVDADETTGLLSGNDNSQRRHREHQTRSSFSTQPTLVEESLPVAVGQNLDVRRASFGTLGSTKAPAEIREPQRNGPDDDGKQQAEAGDKGEPKKERAFNFTSLMIIMALILVSYHQMAFGTLLPVHLLDKPAAPPGEIDFRGGLGLTVHDVGVYLAIQGFLGLFIQGVLFPLFVERVGVWRSFAIMTILYPIAYLFMPFLSVVPKYLEAPGIYLSMILQSFFGIVVVPCALILLKDATPSARVLGTVNGLAMSGCCLARTISPPLAGIIYSAGGSAAAWFSCAGFAVLGAVQLFWVPRKHVPTGEKDEEGIRSSDAADSGADRLKHTGNSHGDPVVRSEEVAEDS